MDSGETILVSIAILVAVGLFLSELTPRLRASVERSLTKVSVALTIAAVAFVWFTSYKPEYVIAVAVGTPILVLIALPCLLFTWFYAIKPPARLLVRIVKALFSWTILSWFRKRRTRREVTEQEARAKRRRETDRAVATDQHDREEARSVCELAYHTASKELGERMSKEWFEQYLTKYMHDGLDAQVVLERAERLTEMIKIFVEDKVPKDFNLASETEAYERQREQVKGSNLDEELKETLLEQLRTKFSERLTRSLQNK